MRHSELVRSQHELAKQNFQRLFPKKFRDPDYLDRERNYKWAAHELWLEELGKTKYSQMLQAGRYKDISAALLEVHYGLNLLGRFEIMALTDALKSEDGARMIGTALFDRVYGEGSIESRFTSFAKALGEVELPGTKITKWPVLTLFPFLANPSEEFFLKPVATRKAAERFGFELNYRPALNWLTYKRLLDFANELKSDLESWKPADLIDIQGFIWVTTSSGYADELT